MNTVTKAPLFVIVGVLICGLYSVPVISQLAEEISVPEPTRLQAVATAAGSKLVWSEVVGNIHTADANAEVSAIEVEESNGDRVRGVSIALANSTISDRIYVPDNLLSNLRNELQEIEFTRQFDSECEAKYRCVHGIARCRPSQTERQAYCPGRFSTPTSEVGLVLSTPRSSFSFPAVEAAQLDVLIAEAIQILK
jgi:hypothetical protein